METRPMDETNRGGNHRSWKPILEEAWNQILISSPLSFPPDTGQQVVHRSLREPIFGPAGDDSRQVSGSFYSGRSIFKAGIENVTVFMTGRRSERVDQLRLPAGHRPGHFPGVIMHGNVNDIGQDKSRPAMDFEKIEESLAVHAAQVGFRNFGHEPAEKPHAFDGRDGFRHQPAA